MGARSTRCSSASRPSGGSHQPRARGAGSRAAAHGAGAARRGGADPDRGAARARPRRTQAPELREDSCEAPGGGRAGLEDVRRIALELRPEALDDLGLAARWWSSPSASPSEPGSRSTGGSSATCPSSPSEAELVDLPRRAGGADQRGPPLRRDAASSCALERGRRRWCCRCATTAAGSRDRAPTAAGIRGMRERARADRRRAEIGERRASGGTEVRLDVPLAGAPMTPLKTRILLADDHAIVRRGLRDGARCASPTCEVVAEAGDGAEAVERALRRRHRPGDPRHLDAADDRAAGRARAARRRARGARS